MVERWWEEAERNHVLPLDNRPFADFVFDRPSAVPERADVRVLARHRHGVGGSGGQHAQPRPRRSPRIVEGDGEGVLLSQGSLLGGWTFFKRGSTLAYVHNFARWREYRVDADVDARTRAALARVPLHEDDRRRR